LLHLVGCFIRVVILWVYFMLFSPPCKYFAIRNGNTTVLMHFWHSLIHHSPAIPSSWYSNSVVKQTTNEDIHNIRMLVGVRILSPPVPRYFPHIFVRRHWTLTTITARGGVLKTRNSVSYFYHFKKPCVLLVLAGDLSEFVMQQDNQRTGDARTRSFFKLI
jgi:hypothetical protein